ncbi:hypothetical protein BC829DRAFT_404636 [Chytridium lagenaria]|nr:hypothetical protein BC829DRAFT_404636 [Chytridium lagenaria]
MRSFNAVTFIIVVTGLISLFTSTTQAQTRCFQEPDRGRLNAWLASGKGPLMIDYYSWDSGNVYNHIMKILAEEILSYPVTYTAYDSTLFFSNFLSMYVWITTDSRKQYIKDFALSSDRRLETAGANGQNVQSGWFIPEWVVDAFPAMASYRGLRDPNVASVLALNQSTIDRVPKPTFAQPSTNRTEWFPSQQRALILTVLPSYANDPNPRLVRNLNLQASVQYAGNDDSYTTSIWRAMTLTGMPVIFSLWSPHQFLAEYIYRNDTRFKMVRLNLPQYDARSCGTGENLKVLSSSLQTIQLYWLAKQLILTNDDVNVMLGQISYNNATLDTAACTWLKNNEDTWKSWLWFRSCSGGCGANGYCTFNKCACNEGWEGTNCETRRIYHFVEWNSPASGALLFVTSLVLTATLSLLAYLIYNKNAEVMLCSIIPALLGPFFAVGTPTIATCNIKIWLPCFSFVVIIGSLLVRNYRIVTIFSSKKKLENVTIRWIGKWLRSCQFDNTRIIVPVLICYKVALVCGAVALAYKTKDIPDRFGESKSIALAIYNMAVITGSFIVVLFIVKVDEIIWFVIYSLTVILVCALFETIFFGRIVFYLYTQKSIWMKTRAATRRVNGRRLLERIWWIPPMACRVG